MRARAISLLVCCTAATRPIAAQDGDIPDRALHRGLAMETGWTLPRGHGAGTLMLMLATPRVDYGITDRITVMGGLPLPLWLLTGSVPPLVVSAKISLLDVPLVRAAAGAFALAPVGVWPYFAVTVGTRRASASFTVSPFVAVPHDERETTREGILQGMVALQFARQAKLLIEGIRTGEGRELVGAGLRLYRRAFVMELAGLYDPDERQIGPWLTFAWAW
jgi:hypothetical protein